MKIEVVLKDMWEKMVPKHELLDSILLHAQGLKYEVNICELEDHVGEKGLNSNCVTTLAFAHDQGNGLQRCGPKVKLKSHISCSWECRRV
jgi:hypothetical protein